ncbi:MAG: hypothetical protein CME70_13550 [Halobacteriovorax sp.]|nr:hypothetical protein [Halobacteriovorax sp.]|tara:strand:+ start:10751 stop:11191 length:441 start_codon:yes stop_codon:yes gene_type:complete
MKIQIRPATNKDFNIWSKLRFELWPTTSIEDHLKELQSFDGDKKFHAFFAVHDDKIIGFLEAYERPFANGCEDSPVLFLEGIWVHKALRRKKVAKTLVTHLETIAKEKGFKEIGSDTDLNNSSAQQAHKKWGFNETSRVVYFKKNI